MQAKRFFAVVLLFFFAAHGLAFSQQVAVSVQADGSAFVVHAVSLAGEQTVSIRPLTENISQAAAKANGNPVPFNFSNNQIQLSNVSSLQNLQIEYQSDSLTSKTQEEWKIRLESLSKTIQQLKIILPPGMQITGFDPPATIFFEDPSLVIFWRADNLENQTAEVKYMALSAPKKTDFVGLAIAGIVLLLVAGFFVLRIKQRRFLGWPIQTLPEKTITRLPIAQTGPFSAGQEEIAKTLSEKEKRVLAKVLEEDGQTQKALTMKTGLSKATLSRTLKNLEQKETIRIVQDGYSNRIYLTDWFKNKK